MPDGAGNDADGVEADFFSKLNLYFEIAMPSFSVYHFKRLRKMKMKVSLYQKIFNFK